MLLEASFLEKLGEFGIYVAYALIALAALGLIIGVLVAIFQNFKDGGMNAIIGVVAIIVFFGIGYALSNDDISGKLLEKNLATSSSYKMSSAAIIAFYAMAIVATLLVVVDIVKGFIDGN